MMVGGLDVEDLGWIVEVLCGIYYVIILGLFSLGGDLAGSPSSSTSTQCQPQTLSTLSCSS